MTGIDVHQHLFPPALVEALRRRPLPPRLEGDVLFRAGGQATEIDARHLDIEGREAQLSADGITAALVSLSSPMGIEGLTPEHAAPLLDAFHDGTAELPRCFRGWAATCSVDPDLADLEKQLARGFVGLQLPATELLTPAHVERQGPLLARLEALDKPLLVHPGPASAGEPLPGWWTATVSFVQQMHAAWHAWQAAGTTAHPALRVCFVALAGLAPLHEERLRARGGLSAAGTQNLFYETSSYGGRTVLAAREFLPLEAIVFGSDRPYAEPDPARPYLDLDSAIRLDNPSRLLTGRSDRGLAFLTDPPTATAGKEMLRDT